MADEIDRLAPTVIIHGAGRGADEIAMRYAVGRGVNVEAYPARWDLEGRSAGPRRNARMLAFGKPDKAIAFGDLYREDLFRDGKTCPLGDIEGAALTGTGDMVSRLIKANVPVVWVPSPDAERMDLFTMPMAVGRATVAP
jgi:hypothetical protein